MQKVPNLAQILQELLLTQPFVELSKFVEDVKTTNQTASIFETPLKSDEGERKKAMRQHLTTYLLDKYNNL